MEVYVSDVMRQNHATMGLGYSDVRITVAGHQCFLMNLCKKLKNICEIMKKGFLKISSVRWCFFKDQEVEEAVYK